MRGAVQDGRSGDTLSARMTSMTGLTPGMTTLAQSVLLRNVRRAATRFTGPPCSRSDLAQEARSSTSSERGSPFSSQKRASTAFRKSSSELVSFQPEELIADRQIGARGAANGSQVEALRGSSWRSARTRSLSTARGLRRCGPRGNSGSQVFSRFPAAIADYRERVFATPSGRCLLRFLPLKMLNPKEHGRNHLGM